METKRIQKHKELGLHYFDNALRYIKAGDVEKASEFLWGSIAQAIKAVAASRDIELRSHRRIREYALELARALKDPTVRHAFDMAEYLHGNFYESGLLLEDVQLASEDIKDTIAKLLNLIQNKQ